MRGVANRVNIQLIIKKRGAGLEAVGQQMTTADRSTETYPPGRPKLRMKTNTPSECKAARNACCFAFIALFVAASPDLAQAADDDVPPGSFIYIREVPFRPAEGPSIPGKPHYVMTSPKAQVQDALALGLEPISDAVSATITAGVEPSRSLVSELLDQSLQATRTVKPLGDFAGGHESASLAGSAINRSIGQGMGALSSAMQSARGALGAIK